MKTSGINLLDELAKEEYSKLRSIFEEQCHTKGSIIFTPEEDTDRAFIISQGRVRVYLAYEEKQFTLALLFPGDLYATHAGCYIQALDDTCLLVAQIHEMRQVMDNIPAFPRTMIRVLGHILQNAFSIIDSLAFHDIYTRLLVWFLDQANHFGSPQDEGILLQPDLDMEQLAQLMGASRQTVSTLLNSMLRAGLLERRGRNDFFIPCMQALEEATKEKSV